jgi:hypothetical protein
MSKPLPPRSTRGQRYKAALNDEEEAADNEFWNQGFFAGEEFVYVALFATVARCELF